MRRMGQVIRLKPDHISEYERLHAAVWPDVLALIHAYHIHNYSIFRHEELLFSYFEYHGDDWDGDMAKMAADPSMQAWLRIIEPLQEPMPDHAEHEWWVTMASVFYTS